jgi:hypothetical protein
MARQMVCTKCAWCGRVKSHRHWLFERRQVWSNYRYSTCPQCRVLLTLADSKHLQVQ